MCQRRVAYWQTHTAVTQVPILLYLTHMEKSKFNSLPGLAWGTQSGSKRNVKAKTQGNNTLHTPGHQRGSWQNFSGHFARYHPSTLSQARPYPSQLRPVFEDTHRPGALQEQPMHTGLCATKSWPRRQTQLKFSLWMFWAPSTELLP